jgi:quinolinate synthase
MGIPDQEIGLWDPDDPQPEALRDCRVVVWKGYCNVHVAFSAGDVRAARERYPGCVVVVHPECRREVVDLADAAGSTTGIIKAVAEAPAGTTIVVGTEVHLVDRLDREYPDKRVVPLARRSCRNMAKTRMRDLLAALDAIQAGKPRNIVRVEEDLARWARVALERMLRIS